LVEITLMLQLSTELLPNVGKKRQQARTFRTTPDPSQALQMSASAAKSVPAPTGSFCYCRQRFRRWTMTAKRNPVLLRSSSAAPLSPSEDAGYTELNSPPKRLHACPQPPSTIYRARWLVVVHGAAGRWCERRRCERCKC
jgi:hypothetical protein